MSCAMSVLNLAVPSVERGAEAASEKVDILVALKHPAVLLLVALKAGFLYPGA